MFKIALQQPDFISFSAIQETLSGSDTDFFSKPRFGCALSRWACVALGATRRLRRLQRGVDKCRVCVLNDVDHLAPTETKHPAVGVLVWLT